MGCKLAVRLNNAQAHVSSEAAADSLIYKVLSNFRILESLNFVVYMVLWSYMQGMPTVGYLSTCTEATLLM